MSGSNSVIATGPLSSPTGVTRTLIICLAVYGAYRGLRALWNKDAVNQAKRPSPGIRYKKWTKREISSYTGIEPGTPILIGVKGKVYDVSAGRGFYGPGASYNVFAGRDASRLLATQSFDDDDAPIDTLDDLTAEDMESLDAYVGLFTVKYRCVGELVDSVDSE
ncbi:cytochrome b5-like heme/steroid binding domain-containing protein [Kickxella alabastrina]|uniref:cytochrome b5-like heme/steroid binding domain-containing protein n=1 Tax=Kickxella alabastrina TaxID=61397 RepID=UPI00221E755E|nr:cytochrome b5-like heme/steroid binding domain-containing protein [Kickxella alabastrina]KAI7823130.1 cytochrome b5-like heme/steroid binding domain-containing protein [Kickxella alabastrina]